MTPRTWAEKKVEKHIFASLGVLAVPEKAAVKAIRQEHQRAVRIVNRTMPDSWLHPYLTGPKALLPPIGHPITPKQVENLLQALKRDILAALQRGRTGRGK